MQQLTLKFGYVESLNFKHKTAEKRRTPKSLLLVAFRVRASRHIYVFKSSCHATLLVAGGTRLPDRVKSRGSCCVLHIDRSDFHHAPYYTWLPIRFCTWSGKDQKNISCAKLQREHENKTKQNKSYLLEGHPISSISLTDALTSWEGTGAKILKRGLFARTRFSLLSPPRVAVSLRSACTDGMFPSRSRNLPGPRSSIQLCAATIFA